MGVYIKGMDMPKEPWDCPCHNGENGRCQVNGRSCHDYIPKGCPLTEAPEPHGRLIDADALADDLEADGKEFGDEMKLNCASWLRSNATPTVIERSE